MLHLHSLKSQKGQGVTWEQYSHNYWGWVDGDETKINEAIVKYANAIFDTIDKYDLDGFGLRCRTKLCTTIPYN